MFTLAASGSSVLLINLVLVLAAAGLVAVALQKLRLGTIPAYLITGSLIAPFISGDDAKASVQDIGALAMVFLLFGIGLHLNINALRMGAKQIVTAAVASIVVSILLLWPVGMLGGLEWRGALAAALALCVSSTAVVLRVMQDERKLSRMSGRLSLAVLIIQDLAVVAILVALPLLGAGVGSDAEHAVEEGNKVLGGLVATGKAVGAVALVVITGRLALPPLLRMAAKNSTGEVMIVIAAAFAMGAAALTAEFGGLSPELGAFLAGFLLASTQFKHHLMGEIGTIRDLFVAIFFTTLGMGIDYNVLAESWHMILIGTIGLLVIKSLAIGISCYAVGTTFGTAVVVGLGLAQAGEFGLVIAAAAKGEGLLEADHLSKITAVIALSLMVTPAMLKLSFALSDRKLPRSIATHLAPWVRTGDLVDADEVETAHCPDVDKNVHVIVAGLGVVGRAVIDGLNASPGVRITVVELNPSTVQRQQQMGRSIVFGDISNAEVLRSAGAEQAAALVLTIPDEQAVLSACRTARMMNPDMPIIARTNFVSRALTATTLGASATVVEEMACAREMKQAVIDQLGDQLMPAAPIEDAPELVSTPQDTQAKQAGQDEQQIAEAPEDSPEEASSARSNADGSAGESS